MQTWKRDKLNCLASAGSLVCMCRLQAWSLFARSPTWRISVASWKTILIPSSPGWSSISACNKMRQIRKFGMQSKIWDSHAEPLSTLTFCALSSLTHYSNCPNVFRAFTEALFDFNKSCDWTSKPSLVAGWGACESRKPGCFLVLSTYLEKDSKNAVSHGTSRAAWKYPKSGISHACPSDILFSRRKRCGVWLYEQGVRDDWSLPWFMPLQTWTNMGLA